MYFFFKCWICCSAHMILELTFFTRKCFLLETQTGIREAAVLFFFLKRKSIILSFSVQEKHQRPFSFLVYDFFFFNLLLSFLFFSLPYHCQPIKTPRSLIKSLDLICLCLVFSAFFLNYYFTNDFCAFHQVYASN